MGPDYQPQDRSRRFIGLAVVALLHVLVIWGLMSGLARKAIEVIKKPIEVAIVDEPRPVDPVPPPPPPRAPPPLPSPSPPRVIDRQPPPTPAAPTPTPVVTAPEVVVPATAPAPPIQVMQERMPEKPAEARPTPPAAPQPTAAPATRPAPRAEVAIVCPGYQSILKSALAGEWGRVGITGDVKVVIRVRGNQILDVTPQSGPREYYRAVQRAVRRMNCTVDGADEQLVPLEIGFREP